MPIAQFNFLEPIPSDARALPTFIPRRLRGTLKRWAKRARASEGLLTAWNWRERVAVFYFWKDGKFHLAGEADPRRFGSFDAMLTRFRLCKQPMKVKQTWNRWWQQREASEKREATEKMNAAMRPELLNMMLWRQKARDGGRKRRKQSHLITANPLAAARMLRAGST